MLRVGIIGATGYAGEELIKLLLNHPKVKITYLAAKIDKPQNIDQIFPQLSGKISLSCGILNLREAEGKCDLVFLALPHRTSMEVVPKLRAAGKKVIDLSADYRLSDSSVYERWYGVGHKDKKNLSKAIYGLPEIYREKIRKTELIANPGCYPTATILGSAPLMKEGIVDAEWVVVDSKSGATGAGRNPSPTLLFSEVNENLKAYKVNAHQHIPEINQELSKLAGQTVSVIFVPHIVPMDRGILSTIYFKLKRNISIKEAIALYKNFYKGEPFIRILKEDAFPQTKDVYRTNYCDIGINIDGDKRLAIVISSIDNLVKGASGQAVQNMNIMCGFEEVLGLG